MMWLSDNISNIIALAGVIGLLYLCIRSLINDRRSGRHSCSCGKDCSTCGLCQHMAELKNLSKKA
ncbi:MAG: FeoB-associated Cys-rich membrane protein [Erysipelotrichaceae bacterium]|nr:FeoB-associated Cys-rich membrane protein [Erysipelotrichaceae bacterium]